MGEDEVQTVESSEVEAERAPVEVVDGVDNVDQPDSRVDSGEADDALGALVKDHVVKKLDLTDVSPEEAVGYLHSLVQKPGVLKIITALHNCNGGKLFESGGVDPKTDEEKALCNSWHTDVPLSALPEGTALHEGSFLKLASHYVCNDVVEITGPHGDNGVYRAHSAQGDISSGSAKALLKKLLEATLETAAV